MEKVKGEIWCDVHGCVHDATDDPYDYGYAESGEEPECCPENWHNLWIGSALITSKSHKAAKTKRNKINIEI